MNFTAANKKIINNRRASGYFILGLIAIMFLGYSLVALNNRFQFDDLGFSALVRDHGLWNSFKSMYFSWETTYNTLILFFLLKWVNQIPPYAFNIPILLINVYCFSRLLKTIFQHYSIAISTKDILLIAALIILISYFSCRAAGNVVYWVTGQIVYCLFLCTLFLGLHFWIKQKWFLASVCMFLFGHTRINYDSIFIALYAGYFFCYWYQNKKITIKWKAQIPLFFFLAGLLTYVIIPGNFKRVHSFNVANPEQHLSVILIMKGWISAFKHLAGMVISSWKQLIILPTGLILGFYLADNLQLKKMITPQFLLYCSLVFILAYISQSTVIFIAIKTPVGYGRIFYFLEVLIFMLILLYGIYLGFMLQLHISAKVTNLFVPVISIAILLAVSVEYYRNYAATLKFARAYDSRIESLVKMKKDERKDNVYLTPLPNSAILEFMEISPENDGAITDNNAVYVRYYQLPFSIYLRK